MDPLNQIIALAKELRRDLRAWIDHQKEGQIKRAVEDQKPERPVLNLTSGLQIPEAVIKQYEVDHRKSNRLQWVSLIVTTLSFGVLAVYAGYTIAIYRANEKAARAAHDTFGEVQKTLARFF